jgi:hypothetical protein
MTVKVNVERRVQVEEKHKVRTANRNTNSVFR